MMTITTSNSSRVKPLEGFGAPRGDCMNEPVRRSRSDGSRMMIFPGDDLISQIEINGITFCEHPRCVGATGGPYAGWGARGPPQLVAPSFAVPSHERVAATAEQTGAPCASQVSGKAVTTLQVAETGSIDETMPKRLLGGQTPSRSTNL